MIIAAGVRIRRREFGVAKRADERDRRAQNPEREHPAAVAGHGRDDRRRFVDARADDDADDDGDRVDAAKYALRSRSARCDLLRHAVSVSSISAGATSAIAAALSVAATTGFGNNARPASRTGRSAALPVSPVGYDENLDPSNKQRAIPVFYVSPPGSNNEP